MRSRLRGKEINSITDKYSLREFGKDLNQGSIVFGSQQRICLLGLGHFHIYTAVNALRTM